MYLRGRYTKMCGLRLTSRYLTYQIYSQQITFSFVSLKIRVNQPIMKLNGENVIYVLVFGLFTMNS